MPADNLFYYKQTKHSLFPFTSRKFLNNPKTSLLHGNSISYCREKKLLNMKQKLN